MRATAQPDLGLAHIKQLAIPIPSKQEQTQIVEEIESRLSICDQLEATIIENLQKLKLSAKAFSNKPLKANSCPKTPTTSQPKNC